MGSEPPTGISLLWTLPSHGIVRSYTLEYSGEGLIIVSNPGFSVRYRIKAFLEPPWHWTGARQARSQCVLQREGTHFLSTYSTLI